MNILIEVAELIALYLLGACLYPLEYVLQLFIHVKPVTASFT
jgi:hypothetical protein